MSNSLVIIPTYNEKENIEAIVRRVFALKNNFHVLVVDDNSPDGTSEIVTVLQKEYGEALLLLTRKHKTGLGTAYIEAFKYALTHHYEYIFEMDADFSHNPKDLIRLKHACENEGFDVAVGSRYIKGVNVVNWPLSRVLLSYFASIYVRFLTGMTIKDPTAGFKCYKRKVLETIDLDGIKFIGYAFQIEMKFSAWKHGFKITEVPIIFTDRTKGTSKISKGIIHEGIFGVLKMKIRSWFKTYKNINQI